MSEWFVLLACDCLDDSIPMIQIEPGSTLKQRQSIQDSGIVQIAFADAVKGPVVWLKTVADKENNTGPNFWIDKKVIRLSNLNKKSEP